MKFLLLYLAIVVLFSSCLSDIHAKQIVTDSSQASIIDVQLQRYKIKYAELPNEMQKSEFSEKFIDTINHFIADSLHFIIGNVNVQLKSVNNITIENVKAFNAEFKDINGNVYWLEFDYPLSDDTSLKKNPCYNLLKNMPENVDTTLSFFGLGQVEWNDRISNDNLKIKVVPFPKDYNYDSAKNVNKKRAN